MILSGRGIVQGKIDLGWRGCSYSGALILDQVPIEEGGVGNTNIDNMFLEFNYRLGCVALALRATLAEIGYGALDTLYDLILHAATPSFRFKYM